MTDRKKFLAAAGGILATAVLVSCSSTAGVEGEWVEPVPGMADMVQGFSLQEGGKASSINMATMQYRAWEQKDGLLILSGESIGNGMTVHFSDTLTIEKITQDSLVLKKKTLTLRYSRRDAARSGESVPMAELTPAKKGFVTEGTLVFGHEVRSFTPEGKDEACWVVDKTGRLAQAYDSLTGGVKNGRPVHAELEVIDMGRSDEGFAKTYESVYNVVRIRALAPEGRVWSRALQDSVLLYRSGVRVDAVDGSGLPAFIVFSSDSLKAEVFCPGEKGPDMLERRTLPSGGHVWNAEDDDTKNLRREDGCWTVSQRGRLMFRQDGADMGR